MGDEDMQNISTKQLDDAMAILDTDNNGQVDWLEFKVFYIYLLLTRIDLVWSVNGNVHSFDFYIFNSVPRK